MFSTKENECVGFESKWKVTKVSTVGSSQTAEQQLIDIDTSTSEKKEIETQTDDPPINENPDVDMDKLAEWLRKVYPSVKKELDEANITKAFKSYKPSNGEREGHAKLLQSIQLITDGSDGRTKLCLPISTISWSSSGRTLAVASKFNHTTWCYHTGPVYLFFLDKSDKFQETPNKKLTSDSCVSVLKFHPTMPNILAGGTVTGDVCIWNIQDNTTASFYKAGCHEQAVTQVSWINDIDSAKTIILASSSLDGFLVLWNVNHTTKTIIIKQKYNIKPPVLQRVRRKNRETPPELLAKVVRGIICFDFSPHVPDMFMVGVEGGLVVQCSMLGTTSLRGSSTEIPLDDPVYKYYEPHEGELTSVNFSPNRKDMFMTTGSEGEIHIYLLDQDEPAQVIFLEKPLHAVSWVPFEEKIVCGCGELGIPEIFNLINGRPMGDIVVDKIEVTSLTHMDINKKWPTTVAIGNNKGYIQLWNVPWRSFSSTIPV